MRSATITRKTLETEVSISLNLDGKGQYQNKTGVGFFDHMLDEAFKQTLFDITIEAKGDLWVDAHHTVEDVGIALGEAFLEALGDRRGIERYGFFILPMDESLVLTSLDISGRGHLSYDVPVNAAKVGDFDTELSKEFFEAFARNAKVTLHIRKLAGENTHHILEGVFKSFGKSLGIAAGINEAKKDQVPSTKGVL